MLVFITDFFTTWQTELYSLFKNPFENKTEGLLKNLLLTLPLFAVMISYWLTIPCLISIVFRKNRERYISFLIVTWWDLIRSIVSFWTGLLRLVATTVILSAATSKFILSNLLTLFTDFMIETSKKFDNYQSNSYFHIGIPWAAISLTCLAIIIESTIVTLTSSSFLTNLLSEVANLNIPIQISLPIFFFIFLFFTFSSYLLFASLGEAFKKRINTSIALYFFLGFVTFCVQISFLYLDIVEYGIEWLFQQNIISVLPDITLHTILASLLGLTIRVTIWTLFANRGAFALYNLLNPTQDRVSEQIIIVPLHSKQSNDELTKKSWNTRIDHDIVDLKIKFEKLLYQLMTPPLQIIGAVINFFTLFFISKHLFELPFEHEKDPPKAVELIKKIKDSY